MRLLVSIHDVSPRWRAEVEALWDLAGTFGIRPALFVVPDWHGVFPLAADPPFMRWLRARVAAGADVWLHGYRHDEVGSPRRWRDDMRALARTAREGEFLTLSRGAARERIERGAAVLRELQLPPVGFVPPAWLGTMEVHRAAADAGFRISEDIAAVHLHQPELSVAAPVIRWSARTPVRAQASCGVAWLHAAWHVRHPTMRVALHPGDLHDRGVRASVVHTLRQLVASRSVQRYGDL